MVGREKEDEEAVTEITKREVGSPAGCEVLPREVGDEKGEREKKGKRQRKQPAVKGEGRFPPPHTHFPATKAWESRAHPHPCPSASTTKIIPGHQASSLLSLGSG